MDEGETDERLDTAADLLKELIHVTKNGFDRLEKKQDETISKIDQSRIEITSEVRLTRNELGDKIDSSREEITSEIRSIRDDFIGHRLGS